MTVNRSMAKKVLVIGAEPGSGSTLGPVIRRMSFHVDVCSSTRAAGIFQEFGFNPIVYSDPYSRVEADNIMRTLLHRFSPDVVLSTLLGAEDTSLDRAAARVCCLDGRKHVAVLDSWMNLGCRFNRKKENFINIPAFIAVPDSYTFNELVALGLPESNLVVTGHPFFDEITRRVVDHNQQKRLKRIGFILQPLSALVGMGSDILPGYTESSVIAMFFDALNSLPLSHDSFEAVLREHPRRLSKYEVPSDVDFCTFVSREGSGWEFVNHCDVVVGMCSTLLVYAFLAAIPTVVAQPGIGKVLDPNILTRHGILPNSDTPAKLKREIELALTDSSYQLGPETERKRAKFPMSGTNSKNIIQIIERECE